MFRVQTHNADLYDYQVAYKDINGARRAFTLLVSKASSIGPDLAICTVADRTGP